MAFLFRRNKSKPDTTSNVTTNKRPLSTRILQINLDELKQAIDAEDEVKKQDVKKKEVKESKRKPAAYPPIKFRIEVEYNAQSWTVDRALSEFISLRKSMQTESKKQLRPFALFPYGASGASNLSKEAEPQTKKSKFALSSLSSLPKSGGSNAVTN